MGATALVLHLLGRIPYCECGIGLWTNNAWGTDTSQHFGDPYSFSHVLHGILFYLGLWIVARKLPVRYRFLIAVLLEIAWEILENTPLIINRYRAATASLDYFGDSILNATGDILFAMLGFWIAWKLPWKVTVIVTIIIELLMLYFIKDNLTLNILMLLYPVAAIRNWQMIR